MCTLGDVIPIFTFIFYNLKYTWILYLTSIIILTLTGNFFHPKNLSLALNVKNWSHCPGFCENSGEKILFYWLYITLILTLIFVFNSLNSASSYLESLLNSSLFHPDLRGGNPTWHQHRCFFGAMHIQGQRCITCNRYRMLVSPAVILQRASQTKNKSTSGWPVTSGPTNIPVPNVHISPRGTANLQAGPSAIRFT